MLLSAKQLCSAFYVILTSLPWKTHLPALTVYHTLWSLSSPVITVEVNLCFIKSSSYFPFMHVHVWCVFLSQWSPHNHFTSTQRYTECSVTYWPNFRSVFYRQFKAKKCPLIYRSTHACHEHVRYYMYVNVCY
jgi:hypothetical protein